MSRLLHREDRSRQTFRRRELLRNLEDHPLQIVSARRRHVPFDRARLTLDGGTVVDLRLVWPGAGTPAKVADIQWLDDLGWVVTILDEHGESVTWYAWALRIS